MTVKEMHYDYKQKLNKIDSQQYRNLKVPEIDWKLNEAQEVFAKVIAQPRLKESIGFEFSQRTIDDIRTIVVNQRVADGQVATLYDDDDGSYIAVLPDDYWFYVHSRVYATKGECINVILSTKEIQHDDESELSVFDKSSFTWRLANIRFNKEGIRIFTGGEFEVSKICLDYLLQPPRIHNAEDFEGGTYDTLDGATLTGKVDCILPVNTHKEIVDLAVYITAIDLSMPDIRSKQSKLALTQ